MRFDSVREGDVNPQVIDTAIGSLALRDDFQGPYGIECDRIDHETKHLNRFYCESSDGDLRLELEVIGNTLSGDFELNAPDGRQNGSLWGFKTESPAGRELVNTFGSWGWEWYP